MAKKLLFVTTRLFWPTDSGRKLVLYYYCKGLHERYNCDIYLYSFLEAGQSEKDLKDLPPFIKEVHIAKPIGKITKISNLFYKTLLLHKWPIQCSLYYSKENEKGIRDYAREIGPDYIFTDMIRTAMYYPAFNEFNCLKVLDMDDLLSARYERQLHSKYISNISGQYAGKMPALMNKIINNGIIRQTILRIEKSLTEKAEIKYSRLYDKVIFVSDIETNYLNKKIPGKAITITVGINVLPDTENKVKPEKNLLTFVGNFGVAANVDSLHWIISDILPKIKHPVKLMIIGKCPNEVREQYKSNKSIIFTGRVENLAEYVQKGQIFLSPLLYGTGIKTKILEAMSMGVPVVTNDVGAEGIMAKNGEHFWIANTDIEIAALVDYLLSNYGKAEEAAKKAKKLVEQKYDWNKICDRFSAIL